MKSPAKPSKRAKPPIPKTERPRAAVYVRLSKARQGSVSIAKQRAACETKVKEWGDRYRYDPEPYLLDGDYFEDNDRGAFHADSKRPAFEELVERMEDYRGGVIVFYALDRFVRRLRQWAEVQEMAEKYQVDLVAESQHLDTREPTSRFFASMLAQFAQLEAETIGGRVRSAQVHLVQRGRFRGGKPPFGYRVAQHPEGEGFILEPDPDESFVLRRAYELIVNERLSLTRTAQTLNAEGLTGRKRVQSDGTVMGGALRGPNIGKWLRNPATKGEMQYGGALVQTGDREAVSCISQPVLTRTEWA